MGGLRRTVYRQLYAAARQDGHLSPTNRVIVVIIIAAVTLAILGTEPEIYGSWRGYFIMAEMAFGAIFLVEYVARLWAAAEQPGPGTSWQKRWHWATSLWGLLDLLVVVASLSPFIFTNAAILRILRLFRLAALVKFGRFSRALREIALAIQERGYDLLVTLALAGVLLLFGATSLFWAEGRVQPEAFGSIPRALWWSIITLTTVGYGDVSPITPLGKVLASIVALGGIGLVAMPTGIIAAAFSDAMQRHRDQIEAEKAEGPDA